MHEGTIVLVHVNAFTKLQVVDVRLNADDKALLLLRSFCMIIIITMIFKARTLLS